MKKGFVTLTSVKKVNGQNSSEVKDFLASEEPLEMQLTGDLEGREINKSVSVTMRTPGFDYELVVGFLFTEGVISGFDEIVSIEHKEGSDENVIRIRLKKDIRTVVEKLKRNFYTTSSCGVCGIASISAVKKAIKFKYEEDQIKISPSIFYNLPMKLRQRQGVFNQTGGLHACSLFDTTGEFITLFEDVGRHNALDKLIGHILKIGHLPLNNHILLLSGRASFELVQKAAIAGVKVIAAVGAPSNLAVELAVEEDITLLGFLRGEQFNIYSGSQRIVI